MKYLYKMDVVKSSMVQLTLRSDSLLFLVELGQAGLELGEYLSATIRQEEDV